MRKRPVFPPVPEELRHVYESMARELMGWPGVTMRRMFGLRAFYREGAVFAMLPEKRGFDTPDSVLVKDSGKWRIVECKPPAGVATTLMRIEAACRDAVLT